MMEERWRGYSHDDVLHINSLLKAMRAPLRDEIKEIHQPIIARPEIGSAPGCSSGLPE